MNRLLEKSRRFIKNPSPYFRYLYREYLRLKSDMIFKIAPYSFLDDKLYIEQNFNKGFGYKPNLNQPTTFNEKIQWRKLYERNPQFTLLADKYKVRDYVADRVGSNYLVPLYQACETTQQINWAQLPNRFVIKPNHGAGCVRLCDNLGAFDKPEAIETMNRWLETNFYHISREWQYKHISPVLMFEEYLQGGPELGLLDYKFFCFDGQPKLIQVNADRYTNHALLFYDTYWNQLDMSLSGYPVSPRTIPKPNQLPKMLQIVKELSAGISFIRVDLYLVDEKIYFGEMTLTPNGGNVKIVPESFDIELGQLMQLERIR